MTKTEVERLAVVETKIDNIDETLKTFIKSADKKYASKTVEKVVYGMGGLVGAFVLERLLTLIGG